MYTCLYQTGWTSGQFGTDRRVFGPVYVVSSAPSHGLPSSSTLQRRLIDLVAFITSSIAKTVPHTTFTACNTPFQQEETAEHSHPPITRIPRNKRPLRLVPRVGAGPGTGCPPTAVDGNRWNGLMPSGVRVVVDPGE